MHPRSVIPPVCLGISDAETNLEFEVWALKYGFGLQIRYPKKLHFAVSIVDQEIRYAGKTFLAS